MKNLDAIYFAARELPSADRPDFLAQACAGDDELQQRVKQMLAVSAEAEAFITDLPDDDSEDRTSDNGSAKSLKLALAEAPDEAVGQTLGRYKLLERVGEGGCGVVYVAQQTEPVRRRVALKVIKLGMDTREVIARFEAERQALAMMDHPNIAKVLDAGTIGAPGSQLSTLDSQLLQGRPYFVMELVRGIRITDHCDQANLGTKERLDLFIKVCQAIQHAHQKGIIHRDIKPSNILVTLHDGVPVPKVIDFGIAKATEGRLTDNTAYTQLHQFIGTPAYMSPEQAEMSGLDIDTRSDIYSLGVLLYELLAGSTPFDPKELMAPGLDAMRKTIREKEPLRPSTRVTQEWQRQGSARVPRAESGVAPDSRHSNARSWRGSQSDEGFGETPQPARETRALPAQLRTLVHQLKGDLDWIVMKCLEKDRTRRYETANGLAFDLKRHLDNEPVLARPPSQLYRLQKMARRNKATTVGIASVALALVLGLGLATAALVRERATRQRERTQSVRADTVTTFIESLLSDQLPSLLQQGNVRGARELISKADALASSTLSNAPAAELRLRWKLHEAIVELLSDYPAALQQMEAINRLLPRVTDDQLSVPRDEVRIRASETRLFAAGDQIPAQEQAMKELEGFYAEFMGRTPPAQAFAAGCRFYQANWFRFAGKLDKAEAAIVEAHELLLRAPAPAALEIRVAAQYVKIVAPTNPAGAEQLARETLAKLPDLDPEGWYNFGFLPGELSNILCRQDRFAEATALLEEQGRWLKTHGGSATDQLRLDALRGAVLARSGNAREALPILEAVATNRLSSVNDWMTAAVFAASTGDRDSFQRLSRICWLRFGSTVEGEAALSAVTGLNQQPMDDNALTMARAVLNRADDGSIGSNLRLNLINAFLTYREHRYPEALVLLDRFFATPDSRPGAKGQGSQASRPPPYFYGRC